MAAKIAVAVVGATGRMGQTTCEAIEDSDDLQLVARLGSKDEITAESLTGAEVAVEFTVPNASLLIPRRFCVPGPMRWSVLPGGTRTHR